ncbi:MAG: 6-bladed beta-propeller [Bacteroidales bacterium]
MKLSISLTGIFVFILVLSWSCKHNPAPTGIIEMVKVNGKVIPKINLGLVDDSATTIKLSELFEGFQIIPLETKKECLIGNMPKVEFGGQSILLFTQAGVGPCLVLKFDKNGKFIRQFGRGGKGPGEHVGYMVDELSFFPDQKQVFISFQGENQLFTDDGEFLRQVKNPVELTSGIKRFNDSIWMTHGALAGNPDYRRDSIRLLMFDAHGSEIKVWPRTLFPPANRNGYSPGGWGTSLYKYLNRWQIYSPGDDTLYQIDLNRLDPVAVLNPGPEGFAYNKVIDPSQFEGTYSLKILKETEKHWYIEKTVVNKSKLSEYGPGRWGGEVETSDFLIVVDKKTGLARNICFEDDFLGILAKHQNHESVRWTDDGHPFISFLGIQLKESITTALKNENLDARIRARLEQLDKQVTSDSNPVIVVMTTKEDL